MKVPAVCIAFYPRTSEPRLAKNGGVEVIDLCIIQVPKRTGEHDQGRIVVYRAGRKFFNLRVGSGGNTCHNSRAPLCMYDTLSRQLSFTCNPKNVQKQPMYPIASFTTEVLSMCRSDRCLLMFWAHRTGCNRSKSAEITATPSASAPTLLQEPEHTGMISPSQTGPGDFVFFTAEQAIQSDPFITSS